jgi:DNA-binding CsgD family transcriptional regulator
MAGMSPEHLRGDVTRLMHQGCGMRDFALGAARILARAVAFEGVCVLTLDPATVVPTAQVVDNGLPATALARMAEIEHRGEDFNTFRSLALSDCHTATLSHVTGGDLARSERHRDVRAPHGFGDELRAALVDEGAAWGALTLLRGADCEPFSPADAELVEAVTRHLAEGLRRALLLARDASEPAEAGDGGVGVVVLAPDGSTAFADDRALAWMDELHSDGALPAVVAAVVSRARTLAAGHEPGGQIARARVRARSGHWLVVRASLLGEEPGAHVAVMIEPAQSHELAPLLADAYSLSDREREVTELVARGLPTDAVAARLHLSPWTVQDHLKAIFEKVGVATRGELVARLFFRHRTPRL